MKKLFLGFVLVLATLFTSAWAEDNPRAVIIFDASGSMWGQINGVTKIEIARDALKNVVREWNPSVELGLTVYGHRSKGDCNDIETIIPVGKIDKNKVIKTVMGIKPKGKTPISRSLRKVAEEIKYTEEKATIILISDGKETCDPDPCGTAKELAKEGIDFITHVIGFNVDKKTSQQLECIANATGGEYFSAKNAAALNKAMKVIAKKVEVVVPPKPVVKKLKNNLEVTASETEGGKWIEAYHAIYPVEDGELGRSTKNCWSKKKKECLRQMPVGQYVLKSKYNEFKIETTFNIKAGEATKLVFGQTGKIEISASETEGGKWIEAYHAIYPVEDEELGRSTKNCWTKKKKECLKQIPVGQYVLKSKYNKFKKETAFEIKANEVTKLNVVFGQTGKVEISASENEGGKWVSLYGYIYPADENGEKDGSNVGQVNNRNGKEPSVHKLPAGKYMMKVDYNKFTKKVVFEVKAGETNKIHIVMGETGKVEISASEKEGGKWVQLYGYIYPADENGGKDGGNVGQVNNRSAKDLSVHQLPVGKYMMNVEHNNFNKKVVFEVQAGKTNKVHVLFGQFAIEAKCSNMNEKISYEVYASSGRLVFDKKAKCSEILQLVLDGGNYSVEAKVGNDIKTVKFTVGGDSSKLVIDMTDIKREPTKEELIKADMPEEAVVVSTTPKKETVTAANEKKVETSTGKLNIGGKQIQIEGISKEDMKSIQNLGALLGGAGGIQKSIESKPMQGIKESLIVALPYMEKTKGCYGSAKTLEDAKLCDVIANEGAKKAQEKMESVVGMNGKMAKTIAHTEWNEEIRVKELARETKDINDAKLYIVCIDKGVGMTQLKECAANNGEFTPKKTEVEQLGDMLKMFGGMK